MIDKTKQNILKFASQFQELPSGSYYIDGDKEIILTTGSFKNEIMVKGNIYFRVGNRNKFTYEGVIFFVLWALHDSKSVVDRDNYAIKHCIDTFSLDKKKVLQGMFNILHNPDTKLDRLKNASKQMDG